MILQALTRYYERLADDPDQDVAPFGFSRQKIGFCVVLDEDGSLHGIQQVGHAEKGRNVPEQMVVPGQSKPSGSGINPCFLWDNAVYMLGRKPADREAKWSAKRFEAFRQRHLDLEKQIDDPQFSAVCRFLERWQPDDLAEHVEDEGLLQSFGVFRVQGAKGYVHQRPAVGEYWLKTLEATETEAEERCLVTGERGAVARIHEPKIKGVSGAQSSGALLVSFNEDAYLSYGQKGTYTVPVSDQAAFQYATALNRLLADSHRRARIGDTTVIYWTEQSTLAEAFFGPAIGAAQAEDEQLGDRVRAFLLRLTKGKASTDEIGDAATPFYVLGLSPNAARLSVRFWLVSTIGELYQRLAQHINDLEIVVPDAEAPVPTVRQLLFETAREPKDIPPLLAGAVMRAILTGGLYPEGFYSAVLRRIRADRRVTGRRAAILKACLLRKHRHRSNPKEVPVSLDPDRTDVGYRLGRWFAVLEKVQEEASNNRLNATIRDRFFSSAMATPASVFPRLIRLHQHHLDKVEHPGRRTNLEKLIQEVASGVEAFPGHLNLDDQGLFAIGYYHQRQDLFTRHDGNGKADPADATTDLSNDKD